MRKLLLPVLGLLFASPVWAESSAGEQIQYSQAVMSMTVILLVAIVGGMALRWMYKHRYRPSGGKLSFWSFAFKNTLVRLALFVVGIVAIVNVFVPNPFLANDLYDDAEFAKLRQMPSLAEETYRKLSKRYPAIVTYHFEYLSAHYGKEEWENNVGEAAVEVDYQYPIIAYSQMFDESTGHLKDMAAMGLGMIEYYQFSRSTAMDHFRSVRDTTIPYRNLFIGRIHWGWGQLEAAELHFRKEIAIGTVADKAVKELSRMIYFDEPEALAKLQALVDDPATREHVPEFCQRYLYTKQAALGPYLAVIVIDWWVNVQWIGLLGALLGTIVWLLFLRRLDPNRPEPWTPLAMTFIGGAAFTFVGLMLYDFVHYDLGFYINGNSFGHDFLYCVFGIGVIEELVKIIPLLLIMQFTKRLENPIHFIVYASVSALGFSFVENLMYFDAGHVGIMHGRVLMCAVFHMFASSTVAFGLMLGKYRYPKLQWPLFFLFFLIASFLHGFYDFWLINETASAMMFLTYCVFIYATFQYAAYINNAVNHTRVFQGREVLDPNKLAVFLTVGLVAVLLFEYLGLSIVYGPKFGNYSLVNSLGMGSFLMFFVVLNLSNIDVVEGEWIWIRLWNFGTRVNYNRALGKRLQLLAKTQDSLLAPLLPIQGEVISRVSLNGDNRYFLFRFDRAFDLQGYLMEYVLIRAKKEGEIPEQSHGVEVLVVAFRDREALLRKSKRKADFKMLDTVLIA